MVRIFIIALVLVINLPVSVFAHSGGTDSAGGHKCGTNCEAWGLEYGEYHKHSGDTYTNSKGDLYSSDGILIKSAPAPDPVVINEPVVEPVLVPRLKPEIVPEISTDDSSQDVTIGLEKVIDEVENLDDTDKTESEDVPWTFGSTIILIIMLAIAGGVIYGIYRGIKALTRR